MANIREYTSPVTGLQPSNRGPQSFQELGAALQRSAQVSGAAIGGAIAGVGGMLEERQKRQDDATYQTEVVAGANAYGTMMMNASDEWDEILRNSDPNDPTVRDRFLEAMQPRFDQFRESFQTERGRLWAADRVSSGIMSLFNSTTADVSNRSAVATAQNIDGYLNARAQFAYRNPEQLDQVLAETGDTVAEMVRASAVGGVVAATAMTETVRTAQAMTVAAAFNGMIEANPEQFLQDYNAGDFEKYASILGPEPYAQAKNAAEAQIEYNSRVASANRTAEQKAQEAAVQAAIVETYSNQIGEDGTLTLTGDYWESVKAISEMPGVSREDVAAMVAFAEKIEDGGAAATNDPYTYDNFASRMNLPLDDPNRLTPGEVYAAGAAGLLVPGQEGMGLFLGAITATDPAQRMAQDRFGLVIETYRSTFTRSNPLSGILDVNGDVEWGKFRTEAQTLFDALRVGGPGPGPHNVPVSELLDHRSPNYIFSQLQVNNPMSAINSAISGNLAEGGMLGTFSWSLRPPTAAVAPGSVDPAAAVGGTAPAPIAPAPVVPARTPGESAEEFLRRAFPPNAGREGDGRGQRDAGGFDTAPAAMPDLQPGALVQPVTLDSFAAHYSVNADVLKAALRTPEETYLSPEQPSSRQGATPYVNGSLAVATDQTERVVNASGYGDRITGSITVNGNVYRFGSGGGGRGSIPFGTYTVQQFTTGAQRARQGYRFRRDAFMLSDARDPLIPNQAPRQGLLIHSSNQGYTAGCIGIIGGEEVFQRFIQDMQAEIGSHGGMGSFKITVGPPQQ
ncbi:MAG: hypothetical protein AB7F22_07815 [Reyranella sp.]|uniref:hypothetical protein n=1 Tax=Reyranella sp. TaxID=1929291 RepID=UPI003D11B39B